MIYGIGKNDFGKYVASTGGKHTREYSLWKNMLRRCYNSTEQMKRPTYIGCSVSDNFKYFQFFAEWCNSQIGFSNKDWELDKDILLRGNKVYSEETCCFVPKEINQVFTDAKNIRGKWPIGVSYNGNMGKFESSITKYNKKCNLGYYADPEEAHAVYKKAKGEYVRHLADLYHPVIDLRVYTALMNWIL